jgi:hypothetical protein
MATSKHWNDLHRQVADLRRQFLPPVFNSLGSYPDGPRVHAHTRAFLVFSHAEIESYLESLAKEIARTTEEAWKKSQKITEPLAFLIATRAERIAIPPKLLKQGTNDTPQQLRNILSKLFPEYYKQIKDNSGIREYNVLMLFGPLGLPAAALGSTLLPSLDSLGALRGDYAHQSAKAVVNVLDPETEYKRVTDLVRELNSVDQWFLSYKRRIR